MRKVIIALIVTILTIITLMFCLENSVYADLILDDYLIDSFKNNTSQSNSTYSNNTNYTNSSTFSNTTNTIEPKSPQIEKDYDMLPIGLISGGLVMITVGTSIIVLNKSKKGDN